MATVIQRFSDAWWLWRLLLLLVVSYFVYVVILFFLQRKVVYPGTMLAAPAAPAGPGRLSQPVRLDLPGGPLIARYLPPPEDGRRHAAMILCHGNMELAADLSPRFEELRRLGLAVMLLEYPGFGGMPGSPTEQSTTAAAMAAYDALLKRPEVDPARIVAFGRSLGGGVACSLARQRPLRALILQSTFTSLRPFSVRYLVPPFLLLDVYDNRASLAVYPGPVLILHGRQDRVVPAEQGRQLAAIGRRVRLVEFEAGHDDIIELPQFWDTIGRFLRSEGIIDSAQGGPDP